VTYDLQLVSVGKVYDNGTPAVIDFNLEVSKGEFIAFLGPSGCGKTTTLRMIAGFESITSGNILIRGKRINNVPPERRPTAMIFQNYALFPHMTLRGNVRFGLEMKKMPAAERNARVERMLDKLGLTEVGDFKPGKAADFVYLRPQEGGVLEAAVRHAQDPAQALAAIFTLAGVESVREVRVEGDVVFAAEA